MSVLEASPIEVNRNIVDLEYAVRGPIPRRAAELKRQGRDVIQCNIGNPQALGQSPITLYRQVLSLVEDPARITRERQLKKIFASSSQMSRTVGSADFLSDYVLDFSDRFLAQLEYGLGAYSESSGPSFIREAIANFIDKRDGFDSSPDLKSNPRNIFITNGASEAVRYVIDLLIAQKNDGIMIPIPQYPLYSATIKKAGGVQVNYYLDEDSGWKLKRSELEASITLAQKNGVNVKGIVVINPGNPTGAILDKVTIRDVIDFAVQNKLFIIADEVYQENVYGATFLSFAKALGEQPVPLFSLHSVSKGFIGECGHRGGYLEVRHAPKISGTDMSFIDVLLKQASVSLCSNTVGQLLVYLMVNPPEKGSKVHDQFVREKEFILNELYEKASLLRAGFQHMDSMQCFGRTGALYLFPRLDKLPQGTTDYDYCLSLLEETGLCTVNGSGFGQKAGSHHLRIAFLPPKSVIEKVLPEWIEFHNQYVNRK